MSDMEPQDTRCGTYLYEIWYRACPIPMHHVTTPIDLELVGIEGNYQDSTQEGLLGSYLSRVSYNPVPPRLYKGGQRPLESIT